MNAQSIPQVLFLGIAERAAYVPDGATNLFKWNVLGLRNIVLSYLFPFSLPPWFLAVALPAGVFQGPIRLALVNEAGKELGFLDLATSPAVDSPPEDSVRPMNQLFLMAELGWTPIFLPLGTSGIIIDHPGNVQIRIGSADGETIGQLTFVSIDPPPLTLERVAAIRSDPGATKAVRIEFGCKFCDEKQRAYAALEREPKYESEGLTWYSDLPDVFSCSCGRTELSFEIVRRNLHGLLGGPRATSGSLQFVPLYEQSALSTLRAKFLALLDGKHREEVLQVFLQENPVLLHIFPAARLFHKPPILTEYLADFGIVSSQKELVLNIAS